MKKLLIVIKPLSIATLSLLIVSAFLRYYLYVNSAQMVNEFKTQNYREIYSLDTLKISSRLNSLSVAINWVCIEGTISNKVFYKIQRGACSTGLFKQNHLLHIPQANNLKILFTTQLPETVEYLFSIFILFQSLLIFALITSTKKNENEKYLNEMKINKLARQMSHDIRSPLATLNTIVENISNVDHESKALLRRSLVRINEISNKHLTNSQTNFHYTDIPKLENTNIVEIISNIIELKEIEFGERLIKISLHNKNMNYYSNVDPIELERIISNIINNSIEAMASKLDITLNFFNSNKFQILIRDNGIGISQKVLDQLGQREVSTKKLGNGLGVIHAKESIESWSGLLSIKSQINNFTEVSIILPLTFHEESVENKILTILIDDDELVRITWGFKAKKVGVPFKSFKNYHDFKLSLYDIPKNSYIYLDSELDDKLKGEEIAKELHQQGFANICIASGNDKSHFKNLTFLKDIRGKTPPW